MPWPYDTWAVTTVTAATDEPLTLQEVRDHSRIDDNEDDSFVLSLIARARQHVENVTRLSLINRTYDLFIDRFPPGDSALQLPHGPLSSVTSVKYLDSDGNQQTLASSVYTVDTDSLPGQLYLDYDQTWPEIRAVRKTIEVRFIAGYGAGPEDVPEAIRAALLLYVGNLYENREATISGTIIAKIPFGFDDLLAPYRLVTF